MAHLVLVVIGLLFQIIKSYFNNYNFKHGLVLVGVAGVEEGYMAAAVVERKEEEGGRAFPYTQTQFTHKVIRLEMGMSSLHIYVLKVHIHWPMHRFVPRVSQARSQFPLATALVCPAGRVHTPHRLAWLRAHFVPLGQPPVRLALRTKTHAGSVALALML